MILLDWLFDILLGMILVWLGLRAVFAQQLFDSIIAFIGLGMLMALAWLRLGALDLAIAEAALGSGVTGALLLAALNRLERSRSDQGQNDQGENNQGENNDES